jgi:heat shock protein HslJ
MEAEETETPDGEGSEGESELTGTRWNLVSMAGEEPLEQSTVTLDFDNGELGGNASCNHYGGPYTLEGDSFSVGEVTQTLMACDGVMEQEEAYLEMLQAAESLTLEDDTLTIQTTEGDLVYEPAVDVALEGTEWMLSGIAENDAIVSTAVDANITATFEGGVMAGSAGCNSYTADYTVDGNSLTLGDAIRTEMACEDEEVMERENSFLAALENVGGYEITRDTLTLLDSEGNMVMSFTAAAVG